jgi:hypothetical protein
VERDAKNRCGPNGQGFRRAPHPSRYVVMIIRKSFQLLIILTFVSTILGCAGAGYEKNLTPAPAIGWEKTSNDFAMASDFIKYQCPNYSVSVSGIWVSSQLISMGIIVPLIPAPIPMGGNENFNIYLFLEGDAPTPNIDSIILTPENGYDVSPSKLRKFAEGRYEFKFPLNPKDIQNFTLSFHAPFTSCDLPPVSYKKNTRFGGGITNMGP